MTRNSCKQVSTMTTKYTDSTKDNLVPINVPVCTHKLTEKARLELKETKEFREQCLQQLRELIKDNKISCISEDNFLLRFLRARKFQIPRTLEVVQQYAEHRATLHSLFLNLRPEVMKKCLDLNILGFLPYRDSEGRMVFFWRSGAWVLEICTVEEILAIALALFIYAAEDQTTQICGISLVFDQRHMLISQLTYLLRYVKLLKSFFFNSLPARYSKFHVINESFLTTYALRVIEAFLPETIKRRIILHGKKRDILFQHISPSILPTSFGGSLGPLNNDHLTGIMEKYLRKLKNDECYFLRRMNS